VGLGSVGVWIALAVGIVLDALYMWIRWQRDTWLTVALHQSEIYRRHLRHLSVEVQQEYLRDVRTPLMAVPSTLEVVQEAGVTYRQPDREVRFRFADGHFIEEARPG
jgi:hypothetical protein